MCDEGIDVTISSVTGKCDDQASRLHDRDDQQVYQHPQGERHVHGCAETMLWLPALHFD